MAEQWFEAGQESDALIAEKVMGWRVYVSWHAHQSAGDRAAYPYAVRDRRFASDEGDAPIRVYGVTLHDGHIWSPTQAIAAAWEVVEQMSALGFHARVQSPFNAGDLYHAGFTRHGCSGWNGRPDFAAHAATAPLAICRAALAATIGATTGPGTGDHQSPPLSSGGQWVKSAPEGGATTHNAGVAGSSPAPAIAGQGVTDSGAPSATTVATTGPDFAALPHPYGGWL